MLTRPNHWTTLCLKTDSAYAIDGLLAKTDWIAVSLWAVASLVAVSLLAVAMSRRRTELTEALKRHVVDTIGPVRGDEEKEEEEKTV